MAEDRDLSFDAFRGFAIIAVVAIHVIDNSLLRTDLSGVGWRFYIAILCRQLLNFAVPAFIFISGYWMSKKHIESLEGYKTFLTRRLSRVLVPYFFWSLVLIGSAVIRTHSIDVYEVILKLLTGRASTVYFFIMVIVQLYVATPLLQYINRKPYGLVLILALNGVSLLFVYLSRLNLSYRIPASSAFYSWVIYYEIGLLVGTYGSKVFVSKRLGDFILPALLLSLLMSEQEATILLSKGSDKYFAIAPLKISSFLYSACVILAFLHLRERLSYWPKFLATIGRYSFGIYLIHMIILNPLASLLQRFDVVYSLQPLYQLLLVFVTMSICVLVISISRRLLPKFFYSKILGFCS